MVNGSLDLNKSVFSINSHITFDDEKINSILDFGSDEKIACTDNGCFHVYK